MHGEHQAFVFLLSLGQNEDIMTCSVNCRDPEFGLHLTQHLLNFTWDNIGFWIALAKGRWSWVDGEATFTHKGNDSPRAD